MDGIRFDIYKEFEIVDLGIFKTDLDNFLAGKGAYGLVVAARDKTCEDDENNLIAIKKIEKAFEHRLFTKRTLRELKIMRLCDHENVYFGFSEN